MSCSDNVSFSGVIRVLCIRNLSLHLAARGGSSFIACSMTGKGPSVVDTTKAQRRETRTLYFNTLPRLHSPRIGSDTVQLGSFIWSETENTRIDRGPLEHLGRGCLDLEGHGLRIRVLDSQCSFHMHGERS